MATTTDPRRPGGLPCAARSCQLPCWGWPLPAQPGYGGAVAVPTRGGDLAVRPWRSPSRQPRPGRTATPPLRGRGHHRPSPGRPPQRPPRRPLPRPGQDPPAARVDRAGPQPRPRGHLAHRHPAGEQRSEEHTSELQSLAYLVCRLLLEKKKKKILIHFYMKKKKKNKKI